MTDTRDHDSSQKSIPNLKVLAGADPRAAAAAKVKAKDIHAMIVDAMLADTITRWPAFPVKLHRAVDHAGQSLAYEEQDGIVRRVANDRLDELIATYWVTVRRTGVPLGTMTADDVAKTRRLWFASAPGRREPFPILTWKSDPRAAFHKMSFDPIPEPRDTPLFDELMSRVTNTAALACWIGSIFDEASQRQQYVWIYGPGASGKGSLVRALQSVLGTASSSDEAPAGRPERFWTMGLLGRRLVVFSDCDAPQFVTTGLFKALTGEDAIRVEIKQGAVLSLPIPAKFLFTSNEKPAVTGQVHDARRVIYCSVSEPPGRYHGADYEAALRAEVPDFISACWWQYLATSEGNPRAVFESDNAAEVAELVQDTNHEALAFIEGYLRFDFDAAGQVRSDSRLKTTAADMRSAMINAGYRTEDERRTIRDLLERMYGVKPRSVRSGKEVFWGFRGVMLDGTYPG